MVAICHNSDVGDAWEWADSPQYPERAASLAYRIGDQLHHLRNDALVPADGDEMWLIRNPLRENCSHLTARVSTQSRNVRFIAI